MKLLFPVIALVILGNIGITLYFYVFNESNKILIVESYHKEYEWDRSYKEGLSEKLSSDYELISFEMDTKRVPSSEYENRAKLAYETFEQTDPSLVILGDDNALKYLGPRLSKTGVPVVYLGINRNPEDYLGRNTANFTGVLERPLLKRSLYTVTKILGADIKKVLVLFDSGTTSKASLDHYFHGSEQINLSGITVDLRLIGEWDLWKQTVLQSQQNGYDAIFIGLYHTIFDKDDKHINADRVLTWTTKNTPVPHFGFWDFSVGPDKTIGGLVLYGKQQGLAAGEIAKRILAFDKKPSDIAPKIAERGRYLFSRSLLEKYNLKLPKEFAFEADFVD